VQETDDLVEAAAESDLMYVTRIQKERFTDIKEYEKVKGSYVIDRNLVEKAKKGSSSCILSQGLMRSQGRSIPTKAQLISDRCVMAWLCGWHCWHWSLE